MVAARNRGTRAKGSMVRKDHTTRRIVITFDDVTFEEVNNLAQKQQTSFAEIVRQMVEHRLEDLKLKP